MKAGALCLTLALCGFALTGCGSENKQKEETKSPSQVQTAGQPAAAPEGTAAPRPKTEKESMTYANDLPQISHRDIGVGGAAPVPTAAPALPAEPALPAGSAEKPNAEETAGISTITVPTEPRSTYEELEKAVEQAARDAEQAEFSGSSNDQMQKYFSYKEVLDGLELEIQQYQGDVEAQRQKGTRTAVQYRQDLEQLSALYSQVQNAKSKLWEQYKKMP